MTVVFVARAGSPSRAQDDAEVTIGDEFTYRSDPKEEDLVDLVNAGPLKIPPSGVVRKPLRHLITGGWYMNGAARQHASARWGWQTSRRS